MDIQEVMALLIQACPSYQNRAERYLNDNYEAGEQRLYYLEVADFAEHLFPRLLDQPTNEVKDVFSVVEQMFLEGNEEVRTLLTTGFFESLQNRILACEGLQLSGFEHHLGRLSLGVWRGLIHYWEGRNI
ncbi:DUF7674 family protein [Paenibacillus massiliensis]|uniref:DUF7674 family protein n=1 Tax=Paenibacillus massiliensis TaxID=225917 RepID=UPI0003752194|nr:hypothetical protein [Paenibacillus massiliensis]